MRAEVVPESARVFCECGERIESPEDGVIVQGCVYKAQAEVQRDGAGTPAFVPFGVLVVGPGTCAYHWACLLRTLGWGPNEHASVGEQGADEVLSVIWPVDRLPEA